MFSSSQLSLALDFWSSRGLKKFRISETFSFRKLNEKFFVWFKRWEQRNNLVSPVGRLLFQLKKKRDESCKKEDWRGAAAEKRNWTSVSLSQTRLALRKYSKTISTQKIG